MNRRTPAPPKPDLVLDVREPAELMPFLLAQLPHKNRNNVKTLLRDRQVWIEGRAVSQFNHPLQPGQQVTIRGTKLPPERQYRGLRIVFEDEHLIVIEKEAGLLTIATDKEKQRTAYRTLSDHVKEDDLEARIFIVHRLDRETSGLMVFAKSERVQGLMQETWGPTTKERTYLALTQGRVEPPAGTVESYLRESKALIVYSSPKPNGGQHAITHYETLRANRDFSLLKVNLETGRKNQVRVHLQDLGHPLVGDKKYGSTVDPLGRLGLHAWVLAFQHPITGEALRFETAIPGRFLRVF
jgi:23S rRNA pseudouridine1911/1915/1917 synthase